MTAEKKIAQKRLTLLQVAESLRNVSEACRRQGISRSQFYEYKRAFQEGGLKGLLDRPPIAKSFPNETPAEIREKVIKLSIEHPAWGPMRVSDNLRLEGVSVSPSTVRNLWFKEGLESRYKRILRLEEEKNGKGHPPFAVESGWGLPLFFPPNGQRAIPSGECRTISTLRG